MSELQQQPRSSAETEAPPATPRIYVGSVADYNNGRLHGRWLDAAREPEDLQADVAAMLATSPMGQEATAWRIFDWHHFGRLRLDECTDLETVSRLANGIVQHGEAFAAFAALVGAGEAKVEQFEKRYWGCWGSRAAFGAELLGDLGATRLLDELPVTLQRYLHVDYNAFVRDLEIDGDLHTVDLLDGQVAVFGSG